MERDTPNDPPPATHFPTCCVNTGCGQVAKLHDRAERALSYAGTSIKQLDRLLAMCEILAKKDRAWQAAHLEGLQVRNGFDVVRHEASELWQATRDAEVS